MPDSKEKKPSLKSSFIRQLIVFSIFSVVLLVSLRFCMRNYTNHGESIEVADYRNMTIDEAKKLIKKKKLRYAIQDSTYNGDLPPGAIIDQNPRPESKVKKKRTIYFVVNTDNPPPVKMPDLIDNTLRQAELRLSNLGLSVGKKTYKPDLARDVVLEQYYNGKQIKAGAEILKGESIDLVLGDGFGNTTMSIPNLVGLDYAEAIITLNDFGLNVGKLVQEGNITDLNKAIVFEQNPASVVGQTLQKGASIDLYVSGIPN